jgi:DNA-binding NarL/FixJ family response regulator
MPSRLDSRALGAQIPPTVLTVREAEVLKLVAEGLTNTEIAARLVIAPTTVRTHLENIFEKLGIHTRTAAAAWLHDWGRTV